MNETWIKIFTKFLNWEWYKDQNTKALFIHCLLNANWKDGKFESYDVPRGSFVTGRKKLSQELGLTEQEIRTALKHLISTNELTIKKTNKFSIISIVNFEKYQQTNQQTNQQLTNNQPTTNQQNLKKIEILTNILTNTSALSVLKKREIDNQQTNQQLTNRNEKNTENQPQSKNIEYKNNSVCNNMHANDEIFNCHLGCIYKTMDCKNCMKKWKCTLPDDPSFKRFYGKTFYEYVAEIELRKLEVAEELESMKNNSNQDFEIVDLLDEKNIGGI